MGSEQSSHDNIHTFEQLFFHFHNDINKYTSSITPINVNRIDENGETLLTYISSRINRYKYDIIMQIFDSLFENDCDVNLCNKKFKTPLELMSRTHNKNIKVFKHTIELLERGATIEVNGNYNVILNNFIVGASKNPYDVNKKIKGAAEQYKKYIESLSKIIDMLIERGANINNQDLDVVNTPLHYAVNYNCVHITKLLLEKSADPNIQNNYGNTPIAYCSVSNNNKINTEMIDLLIEHGADPHIKNNDGEDAATMINNNFKYISITFNQ